MVIRTLGVGMSAVRFRLARHSGNYINFFKINALASLAVFLYEGQKFKIGETALLRTLTAYEGEKFLQIYDLLEKRKKR